MCNYWTLRIYVTQKNLTILKYIKYEVSINKLIALKWSCLYNDLGNLLNFKLFKLIEHFDYNLRIFF